jgi:glyceraldehyde-3-phosphate dehydrogenase (NADP+)
MTTRHRLWINGHWVDGQAGQSTLHSPFDGTPVATVELASKSQMEEALSATRAAFSVYRRSSRYLRSRLLELIREGIRDRKAEFVELLVREAGKPVSIAEIEIARALVTFGTAAEEAKRFGGDIIPVDTDAGGRAYHEALSYWYPRGPVLGITPFNFPLNLVAHKVAPALAAGCSILIKPAPQTPGAAVLLAEIFAQAAAQAGDAREQIPLSLFQVVSTSNEVAEMAVSDSRITSVSFTGSVAVGWKLQEKAIGKKITLELGGNAAVIVHSDADLRRAAQRCASGGFAYAGQSCISVQRIHVQKTICAEFEQLLNEETKKLQTGDPRLKETTVGPLINTAAADRVMSWIDEAKVSGARVLSGGSRQNNVIAPTILADVKPGMKVVCEEVFAPLVVVESYDNFADALAMVNDSRFGLQAGVFTDSARLQREAIETLEVGGVLINEVPTYRADQMPYGGVKESGLGREGLRYAMEEYSERRTVISWRG